MREDKRGPGIKKERERERERERKRGQHWLSDDKETIAVHVLNIQ